MDIKEIALKYSREYLTFKLGGRKGLDVEEIVCDDEIYEEIVNELAQQFEALIESYKAELLKEVGEPVGLFDVYNGDSYIQIKPEYSDETTVKLYTFDQVAAAIAKATKPLEERRCEICGYAEHHREHTSCLRTQLAAAQEEIKTVTEQKNRMWFEMQTAQDQLAKAEQRVAEYNELIYAVQTKHHDETRHQTALRYIRNAENRQSYTAANGASS